MSVLPSCFRMGLLGLAVLGVLLASSPVEASPQCPDPSNLLANCGFEGGITSWAVNFNTVISANTADAHTGSGSIQVERELAGQSN